MRAQVDGSPSSSHQVTQVPAKSPVEPGRPDAVPGAAAAATSAAPIIRTANTVRNLVLIVLPREPDSRAARLQRPGTTHVLSRRWNRNRHA
jgi:hypothetical protein